MIVLPDGGPAPTWSTWDEPPRAKTFALGPVVTMAGIVLAALREHARATALAVASRA